MFWWLLVEMHLHLFHICKSDKWISETVVIFPCSENGFKQGWLDPHTLTAALSIPRKQLCKPTTETRVCVIGRLLRTHKWNKGKSGWIGGMLECGTVIRPDRPTVLWDFPYVSPKGCDHRFSLLPPEEYCTDVCCGVGRTERGNRCAVKGATFRPIRPSGRSC